MKTRGILRPGFYIGECFVQLTYRSRIANIAKKDESFSRKTAMRKGAREIPNRNLISRGV